MTSSESPISRPKTYDLIVLEEVDSTMEHAKRIQSDWFDRDKRGPVWIWAKRQLAGRGRRGRSWTSGDSGNLTATLLLKPDLSVEAAAQISFVAALALAEALDTYIDPASVTLKWPNDVLAMDKKIAGILLESSASTASKLDWVSVGFGVNLVTFPTDTPYPTTSLQASLGDHEPPTPDVFLASLTSSFEKFLLIFIEQGFEAIRQLWLARAKGLGEPIVARLMQEEIEGTFLSLTADGALRIRLQSGEERVISAGEVFFPQG